MNNSNDIFDILFRLFLKSTFNPQSRNDKNSSGDDTMMFALLGILVFVGADAIKVMFRKNFGANGLSLLRIFIAFITFEAVAGLAYYFSLPETEINPDYGTRQSYLLVCGFYALLGFIVLIKGIIHKKQSALIRVHPEFKGESHLLSFLIESGWSVNTVQNWAEPLLVLSVGALFSSVNLLWGLPLVFCVISIWSFPIMQYLIGQNPVSAKMEHHGYSKRDDDFSQMRY